jgi:hypothetical protein
MRKRRSAPRARLVTLMESWSGWVAVCDGKMIAHGGTRDAAEAAAIARGYRTRTLLTRRRAK